MGIYMDIFEEELDSRSQNGVARFMNAMVDYFFNQMTTAEKLTVVFQNVLSVAAAIVCGLPHKSECGAGLSKCLSLPRERFIHAKLTTQVEQTILEQLTQS